MAGPRPRPAAARRRGSRRRSSPSPRGPSSGWPQSLLHTLNAGHLRLYEAEGLRDELMGLRLRQSASGAWSFDHTRGGHDDRAVALSLMTVSALERRSRRPTSLGRFYLDDPRPRNWRIDTGGGSHPRPPRIVH